MVEAYEEIKQKYKSLDFEIEEKLNNIESKLNNLKEANPNEKRGTNATKNVLPRVEAKNRNKEIIKHLNIARGQLRSRAIYYPAEMTWCSIMHEYKQSPSMPAITWQ